MTTLNLSYPGHHVLLNSKPNTLISGAPTVDIITVQARRTLSITLTNTFTDITLDATDFETNAAIIEHNNVSTDRIDIKKSGIYLIHYNVSFGPMTTDTQTGTVHGRVRINDTTVIAGSDSYGGIARISFFGGIAQNQISNYVAVSLNAGDFLTLQLTMLDANSAPTTFGPILIVMKLDGIQGILGTNGDLVWKGVWSNLTTYNFGHTVEDDGSSFVANTTTLGNNPPAVQWDAFADKGTTGFSWEGAWIAINYVIDDLVQFEGSTFINILNTTLSQDPTNSTFWQLYAAKGTSSMDQSFINFFDGYHTAGGLSLVSAGFVDIPLNVQRKIDTLAYTHTIGSALVTLVEAGEYVVSGRMTTEVTVGIARSSSVMQIQADEGLGFVTIPGTSAHMYNRDVTNGDNSCRVTFIRSFTAGAIVKMQARRDTGTDTVVTQTDGCSMMIYRLRTFTLDSESISQFCDDFYGSALNNIWSTSVVGGGSSVALAASAASGQVILTSGATINNNASLLFNTNSLQFINNPMFRCRAALGSTTSTDARFGYQVDTSNSIEFRYDTSLANWEAITISGGIETPTNTGIAASTAFRDFLFVCDAAASQVVFKIDSITVATHTTNIPTGLGHVFFRQESLAASSRTLTIDYVEVTINR